MTGSIDVFGSTFLCVMFLLFVAFCGALAWEVCDLWLDAEACRALGVDRQGSVGLWGHGSEAEALVAALESSGGGA